MTQAAVAAPPQGIDDADLRRGMSSASAGGADLEAAQKILITGDVEHAYLIAALAERAYALGASLAQTFYFDDRVLAAQAGGAPTDALASFVPAWYEAVFQTVIDERWARIRTLGDPIDDPFAGVAAERATALQTAVFLPAYRTIEARINWSLVPARLPAWARRIYGEPDVARLWRDLRYAVRLDEPDPAAAWDRPARRAPARGRRRSTRRVSRRCASSVAAPICSCRCTATRPGSRPGSSTSWGRRFRGNLPSEEIYVAPDFPRRDRHGRRHSPGHGERGTGIGPRPALRRRPRRRRRGRRQRSRPCAPASTRTWLPAGS